MSLAQVCAEIDAHNRVIVEHQTWGHLAPKPKTIYPGYVVFTHGAYGDLTVIESDFGDLPDSPWFYRAQADFVWEQVQKRKHANGVWRFDGYCKTFNNGRIKFSGKVRPMRIEHRFKSRAATKRTRR